jgi:hypothetical protein
VKPCAFTHFSKVKSQARNLPINGMTAVDPGVAEATAGLMTNTPAAATTAACVNFLISPACLIFGSLCVACICGHNQG